MTERESNLTPEEEKEFRELYKRLHKLYPERGYDRDAEEPVPHNVGRGELASLRAEVEYEEDKQREGQEQNRGRDDRDDDPEPDPF